jgi:hypothetical protein
MTAQPRRRSARTKRSRRPSRRWVQTVKTVSTFPPPGLFTKDAETVARSLASKKFSPKGPQSGMRMLVYFLNRAGKGLTQERRAELREGETAPA